MAKKRLQKKREAARAAAQTTSNFAQKAEPLKVSTKKVEPIRVETQKKDPLKVTTTKTDPIKVETRKSEPLKVAALKTEPLPELSVRNDDAVYHERLAHHIDELKWLYCELYQDNPYVTVHLNDLLNVLKKFYHIRPAALKDSDIRREQTSAWYKQTPFIAESIDTAAFAGTLQNLEQKLDYLTEYNVNLLHMNHVLQADKEYAVIDHRKVQEQIGTMDDLSHLAYECHSKNIQLALTLPLDHTSNTHAWALHARNDEQEYQDRYFFFHNYDIPSLYDQTCPEEFPVKAPGNFTWLDDIHKHVMTTFESEQWDLNYRNPVVLNEMIFNLLYLANQGADMIQLDGISYIWKQIGTDCRNLPQIHTILRIMRMVCEIVCPGVLLLGNPACSTKNAFSYLGTSEKPECHLLCAPDSMAILWHTAATRDISLIRHHLDNLADFSENSCFLNAVRDRNEIQWILDFEYLRNFAIQEKPHRDFLNDFLSGNYPECFSRGSVYSRDPGSDKTGLCGTTASLCGVERYGFENDPIGMDKALRYVTTLYAYILSLPGIPVLNAGDELGQVNDYSYKEDYTKSIDSRNLHRISFDWELAAHRHLADTVQGRLFTALQKLTALRSSLSVLNNNSSIRTIDTWDNSILAIVRENEHEKFISIYNFGESDKVAWINEEDGLYHDLLSENTIEAKGVQIPAFGCYWLHRTK